MKYITTRTEGKCHPSIVFNIVIGIAHFFLGKLYNLLNFYFRKTDQQIEFVCWAKYLICKIVGKLAKLLMRFLTPSIVVIDFMSTCEKCFELLFFAANITFLMRGKFFLNFL